MWFGLPTEVEVRCSHCGERDWRTPIELKCGRMICFMCGKATPLPAAGSRRGAPAGLGPSRAGEMRLDGAPTPASARIAGAR
jgi:hypothetical protein